MIKIRSTSPASNILLSFGAFYFFYFVLIGVYIIYLPQMLKEHGYSATEVGVIYATAPMMRFLLPFLFRHYGSLDERIYKIALGMMVISTLWSAISVDSFWAYLVSSILLGGAMGAVLPYVDAISLQVASSEHYGKVRLWGSVGFITIALWMGYVIDTLGQIFVYLNLSALLTMTAGFYLARFDPHRDQAIDREDERAFSLTRYWAFWISAFLVQVSYGGFYNFFTIYETSHGFSQSTISYLWSFGVIMEIVMLYYQGPLLRNNLMIVINSAILCTIVRWMLLWYWPDSLVASYVSQSLHAVSFALYYTATISYVFQLYSQKKLAQQFYLGITFGLGGSLGAIIAGVIYEKYSLHLFGLETFFAIMALIMMFVHEHRRRRGDEFG